MAWTVRFAAGAEKILVKLDPPVARRIVRKLEQIAAGDPRHSGEAMQGDDRAWRYRIGDGGSSATLSMAHGPYSSCASAIAPMCTVVSRDVVIYPDATAR